MNEIVSYIKKNLKKGYTKESLRFALLNQNFSKYEIERALKKVDSDLASQAPILKTKPKISYESYPIQDDSESGEIENTNGKVRIKTEKHHSSFWKELFGF
ncbi:hypothetical protein CMI45_03075 [Candidatus Pacearchaeota archaeon]|nr:hypothetical protein [Candidatus Pacearchaeota archaeon]|tara:strand:+ start:1153 stop:1455 length:303 start_codon:yes stop_codon:yes gene_type:complete